MGVDVRHLWTALYERDVINGLSHKRREKERKLLEMWPVVNFNNTLQAAFAPISFHQKTTNPNCKNIKAVQSILVYQK